MSDFSIVDDLRIPLRLLALIDAGLWPRGPDVALRQNLHSLVSKERIQRFAPEEDRIYLLSPPFHTVARLKMNNKFWAQFAALDEVTPELTVEIGGFGLGSDSPILLDYAADCSNPRVIRLLWRRPGPNTWVTCAESFDLFADMLGLDHSVV